MPASLSTQAQALLQQARDASPFCSKDGQPCASFSGSVEHRTVVPLRSAAFRDWLTSRYYNQFDNAPSSAAFRTAIRTLEARARYGDFPVQPVTQRLAFEGDPYLPSKIVLNLAQTPATNQRRHSTNGQIAAARRLTAALALTRLMKPLLCDVSPADPLTYGAASEGLILAATLASYLPARRSTKVDPVQALCSE